MQNAPHLSVSKFVSLAFQKFPIPCIFLRNYLASSFPLLTACIMFGNLFLIITVNIANMGFALEEFKYASLCFCSFGTNLFPWYFLSSVFDVMLLLFIFGGFG